MKALDRIASWAVRRKQLLLAVFAFVGSGVLTTISFPPFDVAEAAYVFAVPALLWATARPARKPFILTILGSQFLAWVALLIWLRHVTWAGMFSLSFVVALFPTVWFATAREVFAAGDRLDRGKRLFACVGLASLWVVLEYVRTHLFTGFPWLTLAESQWQRPILLQSAAYVGAWGISFVLIFFNCAMTAYLRRIYLSAYRRGSRFCPEFYLSLVLLYFASFGLFRVAAGQHRVPFFRAGVTQPDIPQTEKWDPTKTQGILNTLWTTTIRLRALDPDAMFWPEAVTPVPLVGSKNMQHWAEDFDRQLGVPLVLGAVAYQSDPNGTDRWYNAINIIYPKTGLSPLFYRKRHLVPFGEYVPFRRYFPNLAKFVPIGGDFIPGDSPRLLPLDLPKKTIQLGCLICYEDVFPQLARETTKAGAALLYVASNNAWYGEEAAAYQHAAHSVLRAVENRRPVLRVGNDGWTGWIDEYGVIRRVLTNDKGSIYFRGGTVFNLTRDTRWIGRLSFYTRHGDWFVWVCALLFAGTGILLWRSLRRLQIEENPPADSAAAE